MRPVTDLQRTVAPFEVVSEYRPSGDQPAAIDDLARRIRAGEKDVVLLGATGTGKSATTAWLIERLQRPTPRESAMATMRSSRPASRSGRRSGAARSRR